MEIETVKSASDSIVETAKIIWNSYAKEFTRFYLVMGSVSCVLITYGILDYNNPTIRIWNSEYNFHLNLALIVGIGLLFSLLYVLMIMNKSKRAYFQDANDSALKHKEINSIVCKFTDKSFTQDTQLTSSTINWELVVSKELIDDYVILRLSRSPLHAFVIDCKDLDTVKKGELNAFLDEKVTK